MTQDIQNASATMTVKAVILPVSRGGQCTIRCFVGMYNRGRNSGRCRVFVMRFTQSRHVFALHAIHIGLATMKI